MPVKKRKRKRGRKKKQNKNKTILISIIILLCILVIGITYALFTISLTGTKTVEITTGNISLKIENEIPEEGVILENAFPESDDSGLNETAYEFDLINDGDADVDYTLYLKVPYMSQLDTLSIDYIKYNLKKDMVDVNSTPLLLSSTVKALTNTNNSSEIGIGGVSEEIRNVKVGQIVSENTNVYMIDYTEETPNIILTDDIVSGKVTSYYSVEVDGTSFEYIKVLNNEGVLISGYILSSQFNPLYEIDIISDDNGEYYLYKIDVGTIGIGKTYHYKLQLWIDENADNNAMNKKFEAIAYIYGTQVLK